MPWVLTTPVAVGDLDPAGPYTEVKITRFVVDLVAGYLEIALEYGNTTDGRWVKGIAPTSKPIFVPITADDYITLVTTHMPNENEKTYDAVKRGLYAWMATRELIGAGSLQ